MQRRHQRIAGDKTLVDDAYNNFVEEATAGRNGGREAHQRTKDTFLLCNELHFQSAAGPQHRFRHRFRRGPTAIFVFLGLLSH
ncbi:hypothetical protein GQ600_2741 [Phytophthora cactorum]|nr:hypothetical protein GQ600_2741 [Phytophthora cactorum]